MLILYKDDLEFVTEFPCLLGHPVHANYIFLRKWIFGSYNCFFKLEMKSNTEQFWNNYKWNLCDWGKKRIQETFQSWWIIFQTFEIIRLDSSQIKRQLTIFYCNSFFNILFESSFLRRSLKTFKNCNFIGNFKYFNSSFSKSC